MRQGGRVHARRAVALGLATLVGALGMVGVSTAIAPPAGATPGSVTFNYNGTTGSDGSTQQWVVPEGVTSAQFDVFGAGAPNSDGAGRRGGKGGRTLSTVAVTPGSTVNITVGGTPDDTCLTGQTLPGGFNGGGAGGSQSTCGGFGGGGASDVRIGGNALANRAVIAGGGGGMCNGSLFTDHGGDGGGETGGTGTGPTGGAGGGQSGGGSGVLGQGSAGANAASGQLAGGGGGGGLYGGAGGGANPAANGCSAGGGGSGFPAADSTTGVHVGHGLVIVNFDAPAQTLTTSTVGAGTASSSASGTLVSSPTGISCSRTAGANNQGDCTEGFTYNQPVTLTATPGTGSTASISGACTAAAGAIGAAVSCTTTMDRTRSAAATFTRDLASFTAFTAGAGTDTANASGTLSSSPSGVSCSRSSGSNNQGDCVENFPFGQVVTLTATPGTGSKASISGACTAAQGAVGVAVTCDVTMDAVKAVTATFSRDLVTLSASTAGAGSDAANADGTLGSFPAGISCSRNAGSDSQGDCTQGYTSGQLVTLTATPGAASKAAISGACTAAQGAVGVAVSCDTTMDVAKSVTATFSRDTVALVASTAGAGTDAANATGTLGAPGIACSRIPGADNQGDCIQGYTSGSLVTLTATPGAASTASISGACTAAQGAVGVAVSCDATMDVAKSVTATFSRDLVALTAFTAGAGTSPANAAGTLSSSPTGISCSRTAGANNQGDCSEAYSTGQLVTLTATPGAGSTASISGACTAAEGAVGAAVSCDTTMDAAKSATATFTNNGTDLGVSKACTPGTVVPGERVTCTVTVSNTGFTATNAVVTDDLPAQLAGVSFSTTGGFTCTTPATGPEIRCTKASFAVGSATITYSLLVDPETGPATQLNNSVAVDADEPDPNSSNDAVSVAVFTPSCTIDRRGASSGQEITGTSGADVICGSPSADDILALGGADIVFAGGGGDEVKGGDGNDRLFGNDGADNLNGNAGTDKTYGGAGSDECVAETRVRCET